MWQLYPCNSQLFRDNMCKDLDPCVQCFSNKKSPQHCRINKFHKGPDAEVCIECIESGNTSVTTCRRKYHHKAANAFSDLAMSIEQHSSFKCDSGLPQCCGELVSLCTDGGDLHKCGEGKENDNPQRNPSHYATGYFTPYDEQQWEKWMEAYTLQTGVTYAVRTGKHQSTKADRMNGIININGTVHQFKSEWTQQYHCHRAGKPRLKTEAKDALKRRNAPGSKLIGCSACIFTHLICVEGKHTILQVTMPKLAAHLSIHDPRSIEDQLTLKPL